MCYHLWYTRSMRSTYSCYTCGTPVERTPGNIHGRVFCSRACCNTAKVGEPSKMKGVRGRSCGWWKGGRIEHNGYIFLHIPEHPMADKRGYVAEHRKVMSEIVGYPLQSHEHVHHRNLNRSDNRPENLVLVHAPDHASIHARLHHFGRPSLFPWSPNAPACVSCGTTERRHFGQGRCHRCYSREIAYPAKRERGYIVPSRRKSQV